MDDIYDDSSVPSSPDPDYADAAHHQQHQCAPLFVTEKEVVERSCSLASSMAENKESVTAVFSTTSTHGMQSLEWMHRLREELCDVVLVVEQRVINAQRVVLAACSHYFRAMLTGQMAERNQRTIELHGLEFAPVHAIVDYFYTARLEVSIETVQQLMVTASILQVAAVQSACARFMHAHLETANCLSVLQFAMLFHCEDLRRAAVKFAELHFAEVARQDEFLEQPLSVVASLVSSPMLAVGVEEAVFDVLVRWVRHDAGARAAHFPELLRHVRLWQLSLPFLTETVGRCELARSSLECRDLIDAAKDYHLMPEARARLQLAAARPCTIGVLFVVGGMNNLGLPVERVEKHALENVGGQLPAKGLLGGGGGEGEDPSAAIATSTATPAAATAAAQVAPGRFEVPPLNLARSGLSVAIIKDKLYAIGGHVPGNHGPESNGYLNSVECYDPATRKWSFVSDMKHARRYVAVTALDDRLYAIGGCNAKEVLDVAECYDPGSDTWSECARMRCPRRHAGASALGRSVYVVGGHDGNSYLRSVEAYSPISDQWASICSMAGRRGGLGVATVESRLYAVGGYNGSKNLSTVEYLEEGHSWKMAVPMKTCRSGLAATSAGGRLLVVGGHCGSSYLETTEWFEPRSGIWQAGPRLALARAVTGVAVFTNRTAAMELQPHPSAEPAGEMTTWDSQWEMVFSGPDADTAAGGGGGGGGLLACAVPVAQAVASTAAACVVVDSSV